MGLQDSWKGDLPDAPIKVLNFGLARIMSPSRLTSSAEAMGTVGYMPPEQIKGEDVDERSDIFAVGVILYELLTGEIPGFGSRLPSEIDPDLPSDIDDVLRFSLSTAKGKRFASAADMRRALINVVQIAVEKQNKETASGAIYAGSEGQGANAFVRHIPWARMAIAAAVVVLILGGWGYYQDHFADVHNAGGEAELANEQKQYSASFQIVPPDAALNVEGKTISLNKTAMPGLGISKAENITLLPGG